MQAADENLSAVFDSNVRYEVPIFQRPYVWDEDDNWAPLWDDLRRAAKRIEDATDEHPDGTEQFLGAFVTGSRLERPRRIPTRQVIDGQQRMTTLQVFFASAMRVADQLGAGGVADSFEFLVRNRVQRDSEHPDDRYKVTPLPDDRDAFKWAVRDRDNESPRPGDHLLAQAATWFEGQIREWATTSTDPAGRLENLYFAIVNRIKVVSVYLDNRDDPQVIFEALNYKGVPLAAADLVKNLLFQRLGDQGARHREVELHEKYWRALDAKHWRTKLTTGRIERVRVDTLLAYYLTAQIGDTVTVEHLYETFKEWLDESDPRPVVADVIIDIRRWADTMDALLARPMTDHVRQVIDRLEATNTTTPWPVMLYLAATPGVPEDQLLEGAAAIDSYLMRRGVCGWSAKDYNRLFGILLRTIRNLDPADSGDGVREELARQTADSRAWPSDTQFIEALIERPLYTALTRARLRTLLIGLDTALATNRAEADIPRAATEPLTIEHVLPQRWPEHWPVGDDPAAIEKRNKHVHLLGNLTLATTNLNSEMRNAAWPIKKEALQRHSLLRLTTSTILTPPPGVHTYTHEQWTAEWDEDRITMRTFSLTKRAVDTWPRPKSVELEEGQPSA